MAEIGVGVIGCGYMGRAEAVVCSKIEGVRVVAVFDEIQDRASQLAGELGCDVSRTLDDIIRRPDIQAVVVATPNFAHAEAVVAAHENGKDVFVEKPMALCADDCDRMIKAHRESGRVLMLGHPMRTYPGVREVWSWVQDGGLGAVVAVDARRTGWLPPGYDGWKVRNATSGGHLFHHIHEIDLIQWLAGEITEVCCYGANRVHTELVDAQDDAVYGVIRLGNGAVGSFKYGSAFHVPEHETRIYGTKGVAIIDFKNSCVRIHDADGNDEVVRLHATDIENETQMAQYTNPSGGAAHGKPSSVPPAYLLDAVDRLLHTFIETLRTGCIEPEFEALFGGEAGRSSVAACEAAVKSAKTNQAVRVAR